MRSVVLALTLLTAAGCATANTRPDSQARQAFPTRRAPFNPVRYAARYTYPLECEAMARQLQPTSKDQAWAALRACVAHGHFWALNALLTPSWIPDILHRKGAPALIMRVVAARGGDVKKDLQLLHQRKIPVFSLADALASPQLYQGRLVMLRAEVTQVKKAKNGLQARLSEVALTSRQVARRQLGPAYESSFTDQAEPMLHSPAPEGPQMRHEAMNIERRTVPIWENISLPTGIKAVATVGNADPFFEPGSELVLLAKFEGLTPAPPVTEPSAQTAERAMKVAAGKETGPKPVPKLEILGFAHPASLVLE